MYIHIKNTGKSLSHYCRNCKNSKSVTETERRSRFETTRILTVEHIYASELMHISEYLEKKLREKYQYPPSVKTIKYYLNKYIKSIIKNNYHDENLRQQDITKNVQMIKGFFDEFQKYMDGIVNKIAVEWNIDKQGMKKEKWYIKLVNNLFEKYEDHNERFFDKTVEMAIQTAHDEWKAGITLEERLEQAEAEERERQEEDEDIDDRLPKQKAE